MTPAKSTRSRGGLIWRVNEPNQGLLTVLIVRQGNVIVQTHASDEHRLPDRQTYRLPGSGFTPDHNILLCICTIPPDQNPRLCPAEAAHPNDAAVILRHRLLSMLDAVSRLTDVGYKMVQGA